MTFTSMSHRRSPAVNATLNAIAAVLLTCGYVMIRRGRIRRTGVSCWRRSRPRRSSWCRYVVYHANVGSRPFTGQGPIRVVYFAILITHVVLAAAILPLALITLTHALPRASTARPDRALDAADLALRLGDGRDRVPDAVSDALSVAARSRRGIDHAAGRPPGAWTIARGSARAAAVAGDARACSRTSARRPP